MIKRKIIYFLVTVLLLVLAILAWAVVFVMTASPEKLYSKGLDFDCALQMEMQLVEDLTNVSYWLFRFAAEKGHDNAVDHFFRTYHYNDKPEAKDPFIHKLALSRSSLGDPRAFVIIGLMHERGDRVGKNCQKAMEFYQKGMDKNHDRAFILAGDLWRDGRMGEKNFEKAFELYSKAADAGNCEGLLVSAWRYLQKEKDLDKAVRCYEKAAEKKDREGLNRAAYLRAEMGGDLDQAEAMILEALKNWPDNWEFLHTHGYVLFKKGAFKEALELFLRADTRFQNIWGKCQPEIQNHIADVYEKLGDAEKAKEYRAASKALAGENRAE